MANQLFKDNKRTYASYKNAQKVIDNLSVQEGYHYTICVTEEGRYFPHVILQNTRDLNFHYFINQGCCVSLSS